MSKRRSFPRSATMLLAVATAMPSAVALAEAPPASSARSAGTAPPNIILVLTDDLDLQLRSLEFMPYLKSLIADQGMTFTNYFVPLSLCCPSRTTILRGQFPHNHKVYDNSPPTGGFEKAYSTNVERLTIATALRQAGYRTVLLGKYLNGYPDTAAPTYVPPGWDEWYSPAAGNPYSEYNYTLNENGTLVKYGATPADYMVDVIRDTAIDFIGRTLSQTRQPFFIYFSTYAPHGPSTPAPRHANLFATVQAPRLPGFNEADVSDKPAYIQAKPLLTKAQIADIDAKYRLRIRSLQSVDEAIAAFVATLKAAGALDNTYIFFTSDNGFHMGEHRMPNGKYTPYETDIRVPLVVRGPGIPPGHVTDSFASSIDLAPTFAEMGGADPLAFFDGFSLVPVLHDTPPPSWRKAVLIEQFSGALPSSAPTAAQALDPGSRAGIFEPPDAQDLLAPANPSHFGFDTTGYKYVEYETGERELYLLDSDPYELDNRAALLAPAVGNALSGFLKAMTDCAAATCRAGEATLPPALLVTDFAFSPANPSESTPVNFAASASGTAPYTFTWDLCGHPASGALLTTTLPAGACPVTLTTRDALGARASAVKTINVAGMIKKRLASSAH